MGELFSKIWDFFFNEKGSLTPKITILLLSCLLIFLFVDYHGFFYYYANGEKIEYLSKIEDAKAKYTSDPIMISHLDNMRNEVLNRKNMFQRFASLFEDKNIEITSDNDSNIAENFSLFSERNRLLHTVTSSLFGIVILCIGLSGLGFLYESHDKMVVLIRVILLIFASVVIIWISQWVFGLIPVIAGRVYINYIIQSILNLIVIVVVYRKLNRNEGLVIKL